MAAIAEVDAAPAEGGEAPIVGKRCFIGNLAWRTSWQDLKDKFREAGTVVYANVMRDESGRSKGWGIVEFETVDEAVAAVATLNGVELEGRKLLVREDREDRDIKGPRAEGDRPPRERREPREPREPRGERGERGERAPRERRPRPPREERPEATSGLQVVVQGLPWAYTWKELKPIFEAYGEVERADVVIGRDGRSRGYGTIKFATTAAADAAIEGHNGTDLEGRTLTVKLDRFA